MNWKDTACYGKRHGQIGLTPLQLHDAPRFLQAAQASRRDHAQWIAPPLDMLGFETLVHQSQAPNFIALVIQTVPDQKLVGMVHFSQIIMGAFQSAFCSYWGASAHAGSGKMTEGMQLALHFAFRECGLHRVEANLQPQNLRSRSMVQRLGFVQEGYSAKYLRVDGEWKDHERWAIHREIWADEALPEALWPIWHPPFPAV